MAGGIIDDVASVGKGVVSGYLPAEEVSRVAAEGLARLPVDGKRVLVLIPDGTRTMPMPLMFDTLTQRFETVFSALRGKGKLSEKDIDGALREVRIALLEADVNVTVVKDFLARVKERALGEDVSRSITPGQQVIKIVHEELVETLGRESTGLVKTSPPLVIDVKALQVPSGVAVLPVRTLSASVVPVGTVLVQEKAPQSAGPPASSRGSSSRGSDRTSSSRCAAIAGETPRNSSPQPRGPASRATRARTRTAAPPGWP